MRLVVITAATLLLGGAITVLPLLVHAIPWENAVVFTWLLAMANGYVHFEMGRARGLNY